MVFRVLVALVTWTLVSARSAPSARRDFEGMEKRRRRAARMFERGVSQADVARELEVSRQSVSRWHADWSAAGVEGLMAAGRAGRLPRLSEAQLAEVERALREGARTHGFPTDVWTLARVAMVIEAQTGVTYPGMCGSCCAGWAGAVNVPPGGPPNETMTPSPRGSPPTGRG
jgi:transposase